MVCTSSFIGAQFLLHLFSAPRISTTTHCDSALPLTRTKTAHRNAKRTRACSMLLCRGASRLLSRTHAGRKRASSSLYIIHFPSIMRACLCAYPAWVFRAIFLLEKRTLHAPSCSGGILIYTYYMRSRTQRSSMGMRMRFALRHKIWIFIGTRNSLNSIVVVVFVARTRFG